MTASASELRRLGESLEITMVSEGCRFWNIMEKVERKLHPSAPRTVMDGLVGARAVTALWAVLARDLTRRPHDFTSSMQAFVGAIVNAVGEVLSVLPYELRAEAFNALTALMAEGLKIGFVHPETDAKPDEVI